MLKSYCTQTPSPCFLCPNMITISNDCSLKSEILAWTLNLHQELGPSRKGGLFKVCTGFWFSFSFRLRFQISDHLYL